MDSFCLMVGTGLLTMSVLGGAYATGKAFEASGSDPASVEAHTEVIATSVYSVIALGGSMLIYMLGAGAGRREGEEE
jgi:hypothetical protein